MSRALQMDKHFTEPTVLFASVLKWFVLSSLVGVIAGLATAGFLKLLNLSIRQAGHYWWHPFLIPAAFFLSTWVIGTFAPDAEGHGTEKVIAAVHRRSGRIDPQVIPIKLIATVATLAAGGSAGKEGPCAQIGGGLASMMATLMRFNDADRKKLVICGISAGFAAVFGTPLAGAIFGVEVLFVGGVLYDVLLPSFIAGIMAFQMARVFGVTYFHTPLAFVPVFSEVFLLKVAIAGLLFGLASFLFIEMLGAFELLARRIQLWPPLRSAAGGVAVAVIALVFGTQYLGLGLDSIVNTLNNTGAPLPWYAFLIKQLCTSVTLSFGGSGGIITPIFFMGTTAGTAFSHILGIQPATCAAIGMVAMLSGCANTPISASILALELFGTAIGPYAALACVISFLMTGHRSVYPSQILSTAKSGSLRVALGQEIELSQPELVEPSALWRWFESLGRALFRR
ncbi:MAG: chloride channel protein [Cyanobacteria bacterium REEB65]|nr:chloride channel protein [Cyanobacteria bacterium REEB65]